MSMRWMSAKRTTTFVTLCVIVVALSGCPSKNKKGLGGEDGGYVRWQATTQPLAAVESAVAQIHEQAGERVAASGQGSVQDRGE